MSKKLRGSYYVDGRRSLTLTTSDDDKLMDVGFRLVHDDEFRQYTGSSHVRSPEFVRKQHSGNPIHPLQRGGGMSFRLARDREET